MWSPMPTPAGGAGGEPNARQTHPKIPGWAEIMGLCARE